MSKQTTLSNDDGNINRYFHTLPNIYDDDLDPYEYRLIGHYKRVGTSWEGTRMVASTCQMSVGMVSKARKALVAKGLLEVKMLTRKQLKDRGLVHDANPDDKVKICVVTVVDVMKQNIERYAPVHVVNTPVHVVNERRSIEEEKDSAPENGADTPSVEPPKEKKPRTPIERTDMFKMVARESFGIHEVDTMDGESVTRVNMLIKWLRENSPNATVETLAAFYKWYDRVKGKISRPTGKQTFATNFTAFKQQYSAKPQPAAGAAINDFSAWRLSEMHGEKE